VSESPKESGRVRDELIKELEIHLKEKKKDEKIKKKLASLYNQRGIEAANRKNYEKAKDDLNRALKITPENEEIRKNLMTILDIAFGPKQIQEKLEKKDMKGARELLIGHCSRHPEDENAKNILVSLLNQRAVQAANLAQKLHKEGSYVYLSSEEENFVRELKKDYFLGLGSSSSNAAELIKVAIRNISFAKSVNPKDKNILENFDLISRLAESVGVSFKDFKNVANMYDMKTAFIPQQGKSKSVSKFKKYWGWFFVLLVLVIDLFVIFIQGWDKSLLNLKQGSDTVFSFPVAFLFVLIVLSILSFIQAVFEFIVDKVSSFWREISEPFSRQSSENKKPSYASQLVETGGGVGAMFAILILLFLVGVFLALLGVNINLMSLSGS